MFFNFFQISSIQKKHKDVKYLWKNINNHDIVLNEIFKFYRNYSKKEETEISKRAMARNFMKMKMREEL